MQKVVNQSFKSATLVCFAAALMMMVQNPFVRQQQ
jgi:hypothetical protein